MKKVRLFAKILWVGFCLSSCSWSPSLREDLVSAKHDPAYRDLSRVTSIGYLLLENLSVDEAVPKKARMPFLWGAVSDAYGGIYGQGYQFGREPVWIAPIPGHEDAASGLQRGDFILEVDEKKVVSASKVTEFLSGLSRGKSIKIKFKQGEAHLEREVPIVYLGADVYFGVDARTPDLYCGFNKKKNMIIVSQRLIELTQNDDELAYILAHDISHKLRRHARLQSQEYYDGTPKGPLGMMLLKEDSCYSGSDEAVAQRDAFDYMRSAGYDPEKGFRIVERMRQVDGCAWFSTHPVGTELQGNGQKKWDDGGVFAAQKQDAEATLQAYLGAKQRGDKEEEKRLEALLFDQGESLARAANSK